MINKDIFSVIAEYCRQVGYGELFIKIIVHQGEPIGIDETQPPLRRYRASRREKNPEEEKK